MEWYRSVDKLIHYVNLNTSVHGVHLLYSSPTKYMDAKLAQKIQWPLKTDDQFPYWGDQKHWTWTGYYASRPAFKGYVRACSGFFTAARQLQAFTGGAPDDALQPSNPLYRLERALGTAMHHDAITVRYGAIPNVSTRTLSSLIFKPPVAASRFAGNREAARCVRLRTTTR